VRRAASRGDAELAGVFDYIDAHLDERLRLDDLCKISGMGRLRFAEQFRKATGLSPYQYVLRQRVSTAKSLLLDPSRTVVDVALSTGFGSQAHFSSTFMRLTGQSPAQWRKAQRVDAPGGPRVAQLAGPALRHAPSSARAQEPRLPWRTGARGSS
jgi:transcriptional regulator GlxA family with amidase domain